MQADVYRLSPAVYRGCESYGVVTPSHRSGVAEPTRPALRHRRQVWPATAAALISAALITGGCGSTTQKPRSTTTARASASSTGPSVTGYINAVTKIHAPVANARSRFFHSPRSKQLAQARSLRLAYDSAARQLKGLRAPRAGVTPARALLAAWRKGAADLATVVSRRPFDPGNAWTVAVKTEQSSEQAFGSVLTIP
jgi:hypothetical protein